MTSLTIDNPALPCALFVLWCELFPLSLDPTAEPGLTGLPSSLLLIAPIKSELSRKDPAVSTRLKGRRVSEPFPRSSGRTMEPLGSFLADQDDRRPFLESPG